MMEGNRYWIGIYIKKIRINRCNQLEFYREWINDHEYALKIQHHRQTFEYFLPIEKTNSHFQNLFQEISRFTRANC